MRIVIDLQGAQGASRHRGIGRYSMSLAQAMVRNGTRHEFFIALNGMFPDSIEPIRAAFDALLPQENIRVWHAHAPVDPRSPGNEWRRHVAERLREEFLASLHPDIVHVTSIFEGFVDNAVHTTGWPGGPRSAVTLYDLIPLMNSEKYLAPDASYRSFYYERLAHLKNSDLLLAISDSARQECIDLLRIPSANAVDIGAAAEPHFKKIHVAPEDAESLRRRFRLVRPFVMYSGASDERKNHLRLIKAFAMLPEATRRKYQLAIVGDLPPENREKFERHAIAVGLHPDELVITGRVTDRELVFFYNLCELFAFPSWHEGFGLPALEAISCGAAVIGSNTSSVPAVIGRADALFDPFDEGSISEKMLEVLTDQNFSNSLKIHGIQQATNFSWDKSAITALMAFENLVHRGTDSKPHREPADEVYRRLAQRISQIRMPIPEEADWIGTAKSISQNHAPTSRRQLLVDISELANNDHKTGIQRVVRSVLAELLRNPPAGFWVCPVYGIPATPGYRHARDFVVNFLGHDDPSFPDGYVDMYPGDVFLGLDLQHHVVMSQVQFFRHVRRLGAEVYFVVYDLLPVLMPEKFPDGTGSIHSRWLNVLAETDGAICISRAVADEFADWLGVFGAQRLRPFKLGWFHLGANVDQSLPTQGLPANSAAILATLASRPTFLMVGTVEPRKGHLDVLRAFDVLWKRGLDANLVLVGKRGWKVDVLVETLTTHQLRDTHLFWLDGISDEFLEKVYACSTCLIAASEGEGFGLPLIEAAQHRLPIIARDIPVFREVAGPNAYYFSGTRPEELADAIERWLIQFRSNSFPRSELIAPLTWEQSTEQLLNCILRGTWYQEWMPDGIKRFWGSDERLGTLVGRRLGRQIFTTAAEGYLLFGPYLALPPGSYQVNVHGAVTAGHSGASLDVSTEKGQNVICKANFIEGAEDGIVGRMEFRLDEESKDFEVRIWVSASTVANVSLIEILTCNVEYPGIE